MNSTIEKNVWRNMAGQAAMAMLFRMEIRYVRIEDNETGEMESQGCSSEIDMLIHVSGYVAEYHPRKVKFADGGRGEQIESLIEQLAPNVCKDPNVWMRRARRAISQCWNLVMAIEGDLAESNTLDREQLADIASEFESQMWAARKELMKVLKTCNGVVVA